MSQTEQATIDELRSRAQDVAVAFLPLIPGAPTKEEMRERVAQSVPATCPSGDSYRIRIGMTGDGTTKTQEFVDAALRTIEDVGLSTKDYHRGDPDSDHTYVSGRLPDGQIINIEVKTDQIKFQYHSTCSEHQSLIDAVDEATEKELLSTGETAQPKPSRWGIRS